MATGVGLRIADDECVAAIVTGDDATLPVHYIVRESRLHMSDDGDAELGGDQPAGHTHSIGGFAAAVGDPAGIPVDDGEAYRAEDLWATAAFCLINLAAEYLEGPAEFYATHPTAWPEENIRAVREALDYLGLKSVVLVSERDLPTPDSDTGKALAYQAARAALAAVLSTPAGVTPPDPTVTENYSDVTEVLPTIPVPDPPAQAYSVAIPAATTTEPAVEAEAEEPAPEPPTRHRGPLLIAVAAALIGLLLGGLGVAAVLRPDEEKPGPPRGEVRSEPFATAGAVPPEPTPSAEPPLPAPPPVVEVPTPTTEPEPPPAPEPPPTTTETPPSSTTTRPSTTTRVPPYIYRPPELPTLQIPPPPIFSDPWSLGEN